MNGRGLPLLALAAALAACSAAPPQVEEPVGIPAADPVADAGTAAPAPTVDAGAQAPPDAGGPVPAALTVAERAGIASSALELALVEKAIPDYALIKDPKNAIVAVDNLQGAAPEVKGVHLVLMSREEIQAKADREGDLLFLAFGPMEMEADGAVRLSLRNTWALGTAFRNAGKIIMSGGGLTLRFRRDGSGWKREVLMKWIS